MVRLLYISGMVFFAVLIGDAGNRLWKLYEAGTLFDQYSSDRKAAITLLAVSSCGLGTLCIIKLIRVRRRFEPPVPVPSSPSRTPTLGVISQNRSPAPGGFR